MQGMAGISCADFLERVTFVTGPGKHCGKTTFLNHALALVRAKCHPAFMSIGYDGDSSDSLSLMRKPAISVFPGDIVVSAQSCLLASRISPEIMEALPGSCPFGRPAVARARRPGNLVLTGLENNESVGHALEFISAEKIASTILVDGAINRMTQIASFPRSRFIYVSRVEPAFLSKAVRDIKMIHRLATLSTAVPDELEQAFVIHGILSAAAAVAVPESAQAVLVDDFTKIFLESGELSAFMSARRLLVRNGADLGAFVVILRGMSRDRFLDALDDVEVAAYVRFNPYELDASA
jgi:hypothetical protein